MLGMAGRGGMLSGELDDELDLDRRDCRPTHRQSPTVAALGALSRRRCELCPALCDCTKTDPFERVPMSGRAIDREIRMHIDAVERDRRTPRLRQRADGCRGATRRG